MSKLIFLGTGDAMTMLRYNTCYLLEHGGETLLVDGGGGFEILKRLKALDYDPTRIRALFLTHGHTDHLLGAIWFLRQVGQMMVRGKYLGDFCVYTHQELCPLVELLCRTALNKNIHPFFGKRLHFIPLEDAQTVQTCGMTLTAFDICSTKLTQFGFRAVLADGTTVVSLGDEPFKEPCRPYADHCDWLLSEAFCLYADRERYKPYEKHHVTALDAARNAATLDAKHLILYHTEDYGEDRRARFTEEARSVFANEVLVPEDLETVEL